MYVFILMFFKTIMYVGIKLRGGRPEHINPCLISGTKGVYEHKIVKSVGDNTASSEYLVYGWMF